MIVVAVHHLLDVVVVVVAVMADVVSVAAAVAGVVKGAGDWRDSLSLDPDSCHLLTIWTRRRCPTGTCLPVSASDRHGMARALDAATGMGSRHPAQDALRPG